WQDRPDDWQGFTKQLSRWQEFRDFQQQSRKPGRFLSYKIAFGAYLKQENALTSPTPFRTLREDLRVSEDPSTQSKLTTWIEYVLFEDLAHRRYRAGVTEHEPQYIDAWRALVDSRVLQPDEEYGDAEQRERMTLKLCNPSGFGIAFRMYQKRSIEETADDYRDAACWNANVVEKLPSPNRQWKLDEYIEYSRADRKLKSMENRAKLENRPKQISEFKKMTQEYRLAKDKVERHEALLRWAVDQVRLVEKEEVLPTIMPSPGTDDRKSRREAVPKSPDTFFPFCRLPAELWRQIWTENLPPRPTAHFFEVLNHSRKRHLEKHWSKEFRVKATLSHDSGYQVVYPLLAACPESRTVIAQYYKRLQQCAADSSECFDWIPADDLVVLCFPPKEAPLPERHAITFTCGPARHVGIYLPMEVLLIQQFGLRDEVTGDVLPVDTTSPSRLALIFEFLNSLRGQRSKDGGTGDTPAQNPDAPPYLDGGIKKIYVLYEGWRVRWSRRAPTAAERQSWFAWSSKRPWASWGFEGSKHGERVLPWCRLMGVPTPRPVRCGDAYPIPRSWWYLGSGDDALGGRYPHEDVEEAPGQ
ncbi:hypothetical protein C8A03DRAFT_16531, partial [Achaetomium macrosporum]